MGRVSSGMVHHLRRHDVFSLRARKPTPKREWRLQRTKKATLLGCPGIRLWRRFARPAPAKRACRASGGECGPVFLRFARENPLQSEGDASNEQKRCQNPIIIYYRLFQRSDEYSLLSVKFFTFKAGSVTFIPVPLALP